MAKIIKKNFSTLQKERKQLLKELQKIDYAILNLKGVSTRNEISWTFRALECIKGFDEFLPTNAILECMFYDTNLLEDKAQRRNYLIALSVALGKLCKRGKLVKFSFDGVQGNFYGFPEWSVDGLAITNEYMEKLMNRVNTQMAI